ncbi:hypothetical protein THAOC_35383 [Thalassiosira oceanica]|uniref:Uncharacterized protein n=1 Tax=Thalassiosira oceanica TaxID=159749 RepID=K0R1V3_THAOC|nr:hypothetical protein THAOC_35383 [Thalassiosira oceanica]|eukprot:EJK45975.1 hypothetical protein THAOC_35383 [Thalassiosira oceanica]
MIEPVVTPNTARGSEKVTQEKNGQLDGGKKEHELSRVTSSHESGGPVVFKKEVVGLFERKPGHADEVLNMKFLLVNHTDDPADPLIIHIIWIIIIAQERAELVNLLIDYLHDIDADVFAFCIGGLSCSRHFMPLLHTENKSIDGPHATCLTLRKYNPRWNTFDKQQKRCTSAVKAFSDLNEDLKDRHNYAPSKSVLECLSQDQRFRFVGNDSESPEETSLSAVDWFIQYGKPLGNKACSDVMPPALFKWFCCHPDARSYCESKKFELSQDLSNALVCHAHSFLGHLGGVARWTPEKRHLQSLQETANQLPDSRARASAQKTARYKSGDHHFVDKGDKGSGQNINKTPEARARCRAWQQKTAAARSAAGDCFGKIPQGMMKVQCVQCGLVVEVYACTKTLSCKGRGGTCKNRQGYVYGRKTKMMNEKKKTFDRLRESDICTSTGVLGKAKLNLTLVVMPSHRARRALHRKQEPGQKAGHSIQDEVDQKQEDLPSKVKLM